MRTRRCTKVRKFEPSAVHGQNKWPELFQIIFILDVIEIDNRSRPNRPSHTLNGGGGAQYSSLTPSSLEYRKWITEVEQTAAPPLKHLSIQETELMHRAKKYAMECSVQAVSNFDLI